MSLVKGTQETRTILDFSDGKISKNKVKTALRDAEVLEIIPEEELSRVKFIDNLIRVGMYEIMLDLYPADHMQGRNKLKQYGRFSISMYERGGNDELHWIQLHSDKRFKDQYWTKLNESDNLRMKNLVDIIMIVKRLNNLKMFL